MRAEVHNLILLRRLPRCLIHVYDMTLLAHHCRDFGVDIFRQQNLGHCCYAVIVVEADEADALRHPARLADVINALTDDDALLRDDKQFLVWLDDLQADEFAILLCHLERDDTRAATRLSAIILDFTPLAVALLTDNKDMIVRIGHASPHDIIFLVLKAHPGDAHRIASSWTDIGLVEANTHALARGKHDFLLAIRLEDVAQLVLAFQLDGNDAALSSRGVIFKARLLHRALFGDHEEVTLAGEIVNVHHGGNLFATLNL